MSDISSLVGALGIEVAAAKTACRAASDAAAAASKRVDALEALITKLASTAPKTSIAEQILRLEDEHIVLSAESFQQQFKINDSATRSVATKRRFDEATLAQSKRRLAGVIDPQQDLLVEKIRAELEPFNDELKKLKDEWTDIKFNLNAIATKIHALRLEAAKSAAALAAGGKESERGAANERLAAGAAPAFAPPPYKP